MGVTLLRGALQPAQAMRLVDRSNGPVIAGKGCDAPSDLEPATLKTRMRQESPRSTNGRRGTVQPDGGSPVGCPPEEPTPPPRPPARPRDHPDHPGAVGQLAARR